jgi:hypothetical protein
MLMVKTNDLGFDLRRGTSQTIKNPAAGFNQNLDEVTGYYMQMNIGLQTYTWF